MKLSLPPSLVPAVTLPLAPASLWIRMALFLSLPPFLTNYVKTVRCWEEDLTLKYRVSQKNQPSLHCPHHEYDFCHLQCLILTFLAQDMLLQRQKRQFW